MLFSATLSEKPVAIKMMSTNGETEEFTREAMIGSVAQHKNVIKTFGAFMKNDIAIAIVMGMRYTFFLPFLFLFIDVEEMSLKQFCKTLRVKKIALSPSAFLLMIQDIAMGMNYLSLLNVIHRDMNLGT